MARQKNSNGSTGKVTFVMFQVEGDDATLQEGFRAMSSAMGRIAAANSNTPLPALLKPPATSSNGADNDEVEDQAAFDDVNSGPSFSSSPKPRVRTLKSPQVLDLDLKSGDMPLKALLEKYSGEEISKRYLLIAYWFKMHRDISEVSMDHIHTGFRGMGWNTPKDAVQPLRDMKSKLQWFHKGDQRGFYKINHVGEGVAMDLVNETA